MPEIDYDLEIKTGNCVRSLIDSRLLNSCHDVSSGGIALALAECCFPGILGASIKSLENINPRKDFYLFGETPARYIVSCSPQNREEVVKNITDAGISIGFEGSVGGNEITIEDYSSISLKNAHLNWMSGLKEFF